MITLPVRHLYLHVPFCARRCSYCDFAIAVRDVTPVSNYLECVQLELATQDTAAWQLDTIYLGGGTPSRLGVGVGDLLDHVRAVISVTDDAEITIEANPDDVSPSNADAWVRAGVTRISLGAQSFDATVLNWMHRTHSAAQITAAVGTLRNAGIANISMDLIFALPAFLKRDWSGDLDRLLELEPEHVSLYGLTAEPRTPYGHWLERGEVAEAPEENYESEFLTAHERLGAAGFEHYEVSNYARPGRRSRHNSAYWTGVPYAAVGPSAHRFDGSTRSWNIASYVDWERRLRSGDSVVAGSEQLSEANSAVERVYLGLRTDAGLAATDAELRLARPWVESGWAVIRHGTIVLTTTGLLRLDALAASLTLAGSH